MFKRWDFNKNIELNWIAIIRVLESLIDTIYTYPSGLAF
jgi:hypothetical protein